MLTVLILLPSFQIQTVRIKHILLIITCRSISYSVNNKHIGHISVTAKAVPIALEPSSHELVLKANNDFLAETGFRSSIRLYNRRNHAAEFSWKPIITEKGIAFSIRPARGNTDRTMDGYFYKVIALIKDKRCKYMYEILVSVGSDEITVQKERSMNSTVQKF